MGALSWWCACRCAEGPKSDRLDREIHGRSIPADMVIRGRGQMDRSRFRIGGDTKSVRSDTLPGGEAKARVEKTEAKDGLHRAACLLTGAGRMRGGGDRAVPGGPEAGGPSDYRVLTERGSACA